jgi:hypothetical protein
MWNNIDNDEPYKWCLRFVQYIGRVGNGQLYNLVLKIIEKQGKIVAIVEK